MGCGGRGLGLGGRRAVNADGCRVSLRADGGAVGWPGDGRALREQRRLPRRVVAADKLQPQSRVPTANAHLRTQILACTCGTPVLLFLSPRHPLFPLLALLFEKCEQSTQGSEGTTSASFDVDIENFVRKQEKEGKPFFCEDPETDNLVSKRNVSFLFFIYSKFKICSVNSKLVIRTSECGGAEGGNPGADELLPVCVTWV